jgi:hypothetical protein
MNLETRNSTLEDLAVLLQNQQAAKLDLVTPMENVVSHNGVFTVKGTSVFNEGQTFTPTAIADGHLASKLDIPVTYLRRLRDERIDLYDANINGWTQGGRIDDPMNMIEVDYPADARSVMLRTFQNADPELPGVLRAVLSDRYGIIDNFDALTAALQGIRDSGANIEVVGCDLTETRMTVRIAAPEIFVDAPELLDGYRAPFDHSGGRSITYGKGGLPEKWQKKYGVDSNGVFAGLVLSNSETGGGAFNIVPRLMVLRCTNGLMITRDAFRKIHVGGKLNEGTVKWGEDTERKALELVTLQARDAVSTFLDESYVEMTLDAITEKAAKKIDNPTDAIEVVAKQLAFSQTQRDGILDHFIRGGQVTAGGIMQAVTSFAQTIENADVAYDMESNAMKALELAYAL